MTVMVFCAHSDDQIFGVGGTIAKYAKKGEKVDTVVFSYGEGSHPHFKRKIAAKMRFNEAKKANKIVNGNELIFVGLKEGRFLQNSNIKKKIKRMIEEKKPKKIFTHSMDDLHPDHRAVYKMIIEIMEKSKHQCDVYSFDIWNPFRIRKRNVPRLYVDITDSFKTKMKALACFKSQWLTMLLLKPPVYIRAIKSGIANRTRYAEKFYKIK